MPKGLHIVANDIYCYKIQHSWWTKNSLYNDARCRGQVPHCCMSSVSTGASAKVRELNPNYFQFDSDNRVENSGALSVLIPSLLLHVVVIGCFNHNVRTTIHDCFRPYLDYVQRRRLSAPQEKLHSAANPKTRTRTFAAGLKPKKKWKKEGNVNLDKNSVSLHTNRLPDQTTRGLSTNSLFWLYAFIAVKSRARPEHTAREASLMVNLIPHGSRDILGYRVAVFRTAKTMFHVRYATST